MTRPAKPTRDKPRNGVAPLDRRAPFAYTATLPVNEQPATGSPVAPVPGGMPG
jgi:hypothetical protein